MPLEEQLSLTQSGGVYYEGKRVDPTDEPILFIGLGGTGADALLRIKNEVQQRMPLPRDDAGRIIGTSPRNIAFLEIDTAEDVKQKTFGNASFDPHGSETLMISVPTLPDVVRRMLQNEHDTPIWNWFDPDIQVAGGIAGANGIRQVGRFMLFHNIQRVATTLSSVFERLNRAANQQNLQVFILAGIAGGTGSGTFLDVAYLVRQLATQNAMFANVQIQGYILTPDVNAANGGMPAALYRNGFAALKELDYWMSIAEHGNHFVQEYAPNLRIDTDAAPFDLCHIITSQDQNTNILSYDEILESVAGSLFSYIVLDQQRDAAGNGTLKATLDNVVGYETAMAKPYPANYHMESVGYSKQEIPYTEIMTLLAARVFSKLSPMFRAEPDETQFNTALNRLQLTANVLLQNIRHGVGDTPITGQHYSYTDIWPRNVPYRSCDQWLSNAQTVMRQNGSNLPAVKERVFVEAMEQYMRDRAFGPCFAARLLNSHSNHSLIPTMEGFVRDCREREASCVSRSAQYRTRMEQAYTTGSDIAFVNPIGRSRAVDTYMEALTNWINNEFALWVYHELGDALAVFLERLETYNNNIFHPLLSSLMLLPDIFQRNQERLTAEQNAVRRYHSSWLIDPISFVRQYQRAIDDKTVEAADVFAASLFDSLKRWVGLTLTDVDADIADAPDIPGAISDFMTEVFAQNLTFNIEEILKQQMPAGMAPDHYYRDVLRHLMDDAIPMFHQSPAFGQMTAHSFSLLSVPVNCPTLLTVARDFFQDANCKVLPSSEVRNIQVVKVVAGVPLYAFASMEFMEQYYEQGMSGAQNTRAGVHLRWEYREKLPSPLPEPTWSANYRNTPEKKFTKDYNAKVRAAFQKCLDGGLLVENPARGNITLLVGDPALLNQAQLFGNHNVRLARLHALHDQMWNLNNDSNISLEPHGGNDSLEIRVRENVLRFYPQAEMLKAQASLLDAYNKVEAKLLDVKYYAQALFADLIYDRGFERMLRSAPADPLPKRLAAKADLNLALSAHYLTFTAFQALLDNVLRSDVDVQFNHVMNSVIDPVTQNVDPNLAAAKTPILQNFVSECQTELGNVQNMIRSTPVAEHPQYEEIGEFLDSLIEQFQIIAQMLGVTI